MEDYIGANQCNKIWVTKASTQKFLFSRFIEGLHEWVRRLECKHYLDNRRDPCNRSDIGAKVLAHTSQRGPETIFANEEHSSEEECTG